MIVQFEGQLYQLTPEVGTKISQGTISVDAYLFESLVQSCHICRRGLRLGDSVLFHSHL